MSGHSDLSESDKIDTVIHLMRMVSESYGGDTEETLLAATQAVLYTYKDNLSYLIDYLLNILIFHPLNLNPALKADYAVMQ